MLRGRESRANTPEEVRWIGLRRHETTLWWVEALLGVTCGGVHAPPWAAKALDHQGQRVPFSDTLSSRAADGLAEVVGTAAVSLDVLMHALLHTSCSLA